MVSFVQLEDQPQLSLPDRYNRPCKQEIEPCFSQIPSSPTHDHEPLAP